jgi:hypothetical protein
LFRPSISLKQYPLSCEIVSSQFLSFVNAVGINGQGLLNRKDRASWMPGPEAAGPHSGHRGVSIRYQMSIKKIFLEHGMNSGRHKVHPVYEFLANMQFCNIFFLRFCIFISFCRQGLFHGPVYKTTI